MLVVLLLLLPLLRTASMMDKMWSEKSHSHMRRHVGEFIDFVFCKSQFRISHIIYRNALSTGEELERGSNKVGGWLGQCSVLTLGNGRNSIYSRMDTPRGKLKTKLNWTHIISRWWIYIIQLDSVFRHCHNIHLINKFASSREEEAPRKRFVRFPKSIFSPSHPLLISLHDRPTQGEVIQHVGRLSAEVSVTDNKWRPCNISYSRRW